MDNKEILIGILIILVLSVFAYSGFFGSVTGKQVSTSTCVDTDEGVDIFSKGTVYGVDSKGVSYDDKTDICFEKSNKDTGKTSKYVKEYYCDYNKGTGNNVIWNYRFELCENGCSNGACL